MKCGTRQIREVRRTLAGRNSGKSLKGRGGTVLRQKIGAEEGFLLKRERSRRHPRKEQDRNPGEAGVVGVCLCCAVSFEERGLCIKHQTQPVREPPGHGRLLLCDGKR